MPARSVSASAQLRKICACGGLEKLRLGLLQAGKEGRAGSAQLERCRGYSKRSEHSVTNKGLSLTSHVSLCLIPFCACLLTTSWFESGHKLHRPP